MTESQETNAAHFIVWTAHRLVASMGGVRNDDFHAATTAILLHALEKQMGGADRLAMFIEQRE